MILWYVKNGFIIWIVRWNLMELNCTTKLAHAKVLCSVVVSPLLRLLQWRDSEWLSYIVYVLWYSDSHNLKRVKYRKKMTLEMDQQHFTWVTFSTFLVFFGRFFSIVSAGLTFVEIKLFAISSLLSLEAVKSFVFLCHAIEFPFIIIIKLNT